MKHKVIFFGSSVFGLPSLEALISMPELEVVAIVSQSAKPVGRNKILTPTPVAAWATAHHIPLLTPPTLKTEAVVQELREFQADTFIVAAYGLILPPAVLEIPSAGCLNIHASLLPKYRGASPIAAAILAGEPETGISFMVMDAGVDTGPVISQYPLPIEPNDITPDLETRLADLAAQKLLITLKAWWNGTSKSKPQTGPSTYAPILRTADGQATWESGHELERKIRAYQPWPGVWTDWNGQRLKILSATFAPQKNSAIPGTIVPNLVEPGWAIACRDGLLIPHQVQLAGKKPVLANTLPRNYQDFIGARLP